MNNNPRQPDLPDAELLERFLDGQLTGDLEEAAQARLAGSAEWRAAAELQERIDASLQRQLEPPPLDAGFLEMLAAGGESVEPSTDLLLAEGDDRPTVAPRRQTSPRTLATQWVAAALILICCGLFAYQSDLFRPESNSYSELMVAQIYRSEVNRGFQPDWLCKDEKQFVETFAERQGQGLLLKTLPEGIEVAGLAYWQGFTKDATCVLMRVEGEPVLVLVARSRGLPDHLIEPDPANGISVHTREIGRLTAVEISPFDEPRTLDYLVEAEVPSAPTGRIPGS